MLDEEYTASHIKELCDKKQMIMYALSKKTDISQSPLPSLMRRGNTPTFYALDRICGGLGIMLAQFFPSDTGKRELPSEQKEVLEVQETLTDKEKEAVEIYAGGMELR